MRHLKPRPLRAGFTLIELLVVIGLMLLLVGITVSVSYSGLIDGHRTVGAGDRASGWMLIARSKAARDVSPSGVRFFATNFEIREAQYIEVPPPYVVRNAPNARARIQLTDDGAGNRTATLMGFDTEVQNYVAAGDILSLPEYGKLIVLNGPIPLSGVIPVNGAYLPPLGASTQVVTTSFGFIRKARPVPGEPLLQLTSDNILDTKLSETKFGFDSNYDPATGTGFVDVLFAPNGEVLGTTLGKTVFWVRNPTFSPTFVRTGNRADYEAAGPMGLVVVYTKTGQISTQPVALPQGGPGATFTNPNTEPFQFASDGKNSGL